MTREFCIALGGALLLGALPARAATAAPPPSPAPAMAGAEDPFLWLEDVHGARAQDWVKAENARTLGILEGDPRFPGLQADAQTIAEAADRIPAPSFLAGAVYNFWQDADHVRGLWRRTTVEDFASAAPAWVPVLDLDAVAKAEGANWVFHGADCEWRDERRCLISLSDGGEDAVTVREFDLTSSAFAPGGFVLPKGKQRVAWADPDTLLVAREWAPGDLTTSGYPFIVKAVKRGEPLAEAVEVFRGAASDGGYGVTPQVFHDGDGRQALVITRPLSTFEAEQWLVTPAGPRRLALPLKSDIQDLVAGRLLVTLSQDWTVHGRTLPQGALVSLELARAAADPEHLQPTLVFAPGPRESVESVAAVKSHLLVVINQNVRGRAFVYTPAPGGAWTRTRLDLPDNASITLATADPHSERAYLGVTGFLTPPTLWLIDAGDGHLAQVKAVAPKFDAARDTVDQYEATSSDGTRIPYFVVHPKDMAPSGANPTLLYAYGGFQVSLTPSYNGILGKLWLERGGVYVLANIRGGGEFGPAWHDAGLKTHRQLIYDDFAAVARDLIARKITSPCRLGIEGGSNGGLLMGVQFTQHPELWNAVDIQVPLLDMLRYEQIAAGTSWVGEYGSVANPEERAFLAKISPYNNLNAATAYPEPLIWTTTKDDRVGPQHARKFAARLAALGKPYLFYEVVEGGHGAGANLKERAHTSALEFVYFIRKLID
jgi:prolyl oligopeptidase